MKKKIGNSQVVTMRLEDPIVSILKALAGKDGLPLGTYLRKLVWEMVGCEEGYKCELCGWEGICDTHHKDKNYKNNAPDNIQRLCPNCHRQTHYPITRKLNAIVLTMNDIPIYNQSIHKAGDRVLVWQGKKLVEVVVPEINGDGHPIP